jgi:acetamidase/formamidase
VVRLHPNHVGFADAYAGTAIETPMSISVRLTVLKGRPYIKTPHFNTSKLSENEEYYFTTGRLGSSVRGPINRLGPGVDSDIRTATRAAVRHMIEFLCFEYNMDRVDAYMLCSVAGDLKLHEVVSGSKLHPLCGCG